MKPVNTVIVGAGLRAGSFGLYAANNKDKVNLVGIADINIEKAKCLKNYAGLDVDVTDDYKQLYSRDDVEAVMIATQDCYHTQPTIDAIEAGKHVYIEKPLATTLEDCDRIIEKAAGSDVAIYLGFNLRHGPVHEKVHELIAGGKVGKVTTIEANEWYYGGRTYFRRWNRFREFGGGLWLTKASHDFDILNWLAGGKPTKVYATSSLSHYKHKDGAGPRCRDCKFKQTCPDYFSYAENDKDTPEYWKQLFDIIDKPGENTVDICLYNSKKDTFDNGIAVVEYDNDVRTTYTVNVVASRTTRQLRVNGIEGVVEADMEAGWVKLTKRHTGEEENFDLSELMNSGHGGADDNIYADFFNICNNGGTPRTGLLEGRKAVQVSLAARDSVDNAVPIIFD